MSKQFKFIDLFCGIGGFHIALSSLGGECVFASDIDEDCRDVYMNNFGFKPNGDITAVTADDIPAHNVLCGGFPCQAFSKAGYQRGLNETRGTLFFEIARIIQAHKPEYLILENVRNLLGHDSGRTWEVIAETLRGLGYRFQDPPVIFSPHLIGVPQFRERVVILAQRKDLPAVNMGDLDAGLPTVSCDIDDILLTDEELSDPLPYRISADEENVINVWNDFAKGIKEPLPGFPIWADEFRGQYDYSGLPEWKQNFLRKNRSFYARNQVFIDSWLKKHNDLKDLKPSRRSFEWQAQDSERDLWKLILQIRPSGLRVKRPTHFPGLVAMNHASIIGKMRRRIAPREAARLQSFPDSFRIHPNDKVAYKQFGNSVNVDVMRFLASRLLGKCCPETEKIEALFQPQEMVLF